MQVKILAESTLTSKEQLTVPKVVRQLLDIHAGDSLVWSLDEQGQLVVSGGRPNSLADIRAAVAAAGPIHEPKRVTVEDMNSGVAAAMRRKHGRG
jgi:bifunctional DNA-binding transcriptional regulator/antitoxin component of YhaV-PrlF toxin-antitoxin module